jgi:hypothetical protein
MSSNNSSERSLTTRLALTTRAAAITAAAVVAGAILTSQGATASTSYEATITCPIDGQPFRTIMVGSNFQSGMRLDFKPIGVLVAPYPYPVCPGNGFVMYQNTFSDEELNTIRPIVLSDEYRRLRAENTDYFMIAYVKQRLGANQYDLGNTYLRASWEAEVSASARIDEYRKLAREAFDNSLSGKRTRTEEWWTATVLATEMDRLLGNFNAVELRISRLPIAEMGATYPALRTMLDQIRIHAKQRNSAPEQMQFPAHLGGTVGRAPGNIN